MLEVVISPIASADLGTTGLCRRSLRQTGVRLLPVAEIKKLITVSDGRATRDIEHASRITPHVPPHQIHDYLNLVATLGANPEPLAAHLGLSESEADVVLQQFGLWETRAGGTPIFGLNPGAEYGPAKRWPVERFIEAAREIHRQTNCTWLVFGGKGDAPMTGQIVSALGLSPRTLRNLADQTTLRELMALLKICRLLLTKFSPRVPHRLPLHERDWHRAGRGSGHESSPVTDVPPGQGVTSAAVAEIPVRCEGVRRDACPYGRRCSSHMRP